MRAPAVPLPRLSFPLASMTTRRAASSRSSQVPFPVYIRAIGPSLILAVPVKSSPSTDVITAPGKQGAISSRSLKAVQASLDRHRDGEVVLEVHGCLSSPRPR